MTEIKNSKRVHDLQEETFQTCLGHWTVEFEICLQFGACVLVFA